MRERPDVPFAFLHEVLGATEEPDEGTSTRSPDAALSGSKAAILDATANVLASLRQLLQATEDMVRLRRDRLIEEPTAPEPPRDQRTRERVDLTY